MDYELENHSMRCRLCLKLPERNIEISTKVLIRIQGVTKTKIIIDSCYSNVICVSCNSKLAEFSDFQNEIIENQTKIYKFVEEQQNLSKMMVVTEIVEMELEETVEEVNFKPSKMVEEYEVEALDEILFPEVKPQKVESAKKSRKFCQLCGLSFASNSYYHHMMRQHHHEPRFICDFDGKGFRVKNDLRDHIKIHMARDSRQKFPCPTCPATFLSKSALKNHEHIFHSDVIEEHPCLECGKIFSSRMKLQQHKSTVHRKGSFQCQQCVKIYAAKSALQKHVIKVHGDKKPCEICGKPFAPGMFLNRHMKSHGAPQFSCSYEDCAKLFHSKSALGYHVEASHKFQIVNCPTCNASYSSLRNLSRHIQRQHNNVRVQCEVEDCSHTAARKDYLAAHYRSHKNIDEDTRNRLLERVKELKVIPW